jgi:SHS2 domain-containing protein
VTFTWVEHTGELELRLEGGTAEEVFVAGAQALEELFSERTETEPGGDAVVREIALNSRDRPTLLAEWLGELAYLAEADGFIPERVERLELSEGELEATVRGRLGATQHLVKAVTYHRLELGEEDQAWRARAVLDV